MAMDQSFYDGQILSAVIAWAGLTAACFYNLVPSEIYQPLRPIPDGRPSLISAILDHQTSHAVSTFIFYAFLLSGGHVGIWTLPLLAIAIYAFPKSCATQDCGLSDAPFTQSDKSLVLAGKDVMRLITPSWIAVNGLIILYGLSFGITPIDVFIGIVIVVSGWHALARFPRSSPDYENASPRTSLPLALQVTAFAGMSWVFGKSEVLAPVALVFSSIIAFCKGFAILLGIIDGTAFPIISIFVSTIILRTEINKILTLQLTSAICCCAAILQSFLLLPKNNGKQARLLKLVAAPLLILTIAEVTYLPPYTPSIPRPYDHPMQILHKARLAEFEAVKSHQSQTASQATIEYQRRYGRQPPPLFDVWFEIAQINNFTLVDEFDNLMTSIIPFWQLSPNLLRERLESVSESPGILKFQIRDQKASYTPEGHYHGATMADWINRYAPYGLLPDFDFVINTFDEPRVSVPHYASNLENVKTQNSKLKGSNNPNGVDNGDTIISWNDFSRKNLNSHLQPTCPPENQPRHDSSTTGNTGDLAFVVDPSAEKDFCQTPSLFDQHGFFESPETLQLTQDFLTVLSQCKPNNFNDILYPSPYYAATSSGDQKILDNDDTEWEDKSPGLYWSGSSTGGHSTLENWTKLHRQRLALLAGPGSKPNNHKTHLLQKDIKGHWNTYPSPWSRVSPLFTIKLNRLVQCDEPACQAMQSAFPIQAPDPTNKSISSRYALDIDGNTFSGRFYRLLKSNSCVLKMTAFREWHDDFIWPWVHYIPVSASFEELGEVVRYLHEEEEGRELGRRVAGMGREWSRNVLRNVDLEIVNLRILMEVARILGNGGDDSGGGDG